MSTSSTLIVVLPPRDPATPLPEWQWPELPFALLDKSARVQRAGRAALALLPPAATTVLVVAARDLLMLTASVPPLKGRKLRQALPNVIEEQLLQAPHECHIALDPTPLADGRRVLAAIDRAWFRTIVDAFLAAGHRRLKAVPASRCLPAPRGRENPGETGETNDARAHARVTGAAPPTRTGAGAANPANDARAGANATGAATAAQPDAARASDQTTPGASAARDAQSKSNPEADNGPDTRGKSSTRIEPGIAPGAGPGIAPDANAAAPAPPAALVAAVFDLFAAPDPVNAAANATGASGASRANAPDGETSRPIELTLARGALGEGFAVPAAAAAATLAALAGDARLELYEIGAPGAAAHWPANRAAGTSGLSRPARSRTGSQARTQTEARTEPQSGPQAKTQAGTPTRAQPAGLPHAAGLPFDAFARRALGAQFDLCQFEFEPVPLRLDRATLARLRLPVTLACATLALAVIGLNLRWWQLSREYDALSAQTTEVLLGAFPKTTAVLDPATQMTRDLERLRTAAGVLSTSDFLALASALSRALGPVPQNGIAQLDYHDHVLDLAFKPGIDVDAAGFQQRLARNGLSGSVNSNTGKWTIRSQS